MATYTGYGTDPTNRFGPGGVNLNPNESALVNLTEGKFEGGKWVTKPIMNVNVGGETHDYSFDEPWQYATMLDSLGYGSLGKRFGWGGESGPEGYGSMWQKGGSGVTQAYQAAGVPTGTITNPVMPGTGVQQTVRSGVTEPENKLTQPAQPTTTGAAAQPTTTQQTTTQQSTQPIGPTVMPPQSNLEPGMQGAEVKQLQDWLRSQGATINTDKEGLYGDQTFAAMAQWQLKNNVPTAGYAGYYGPKTRNAIAASQMAPTGGSGATGALAGIATAGGDLQKAQEQNNKVIDSAKTKYDVDLPSKESYDTNPIKTIKDYITEIMSAMGVTDYKDKITGIAKEVEDLENKRDDEIQAENDNPWLTEGVRRDRVNKITNKYESRLKNKVDYLTLLNNTLDDARQEAQFIASNAIDMYNADRNYQLDVLQLTQKAEQNLKDNVISVQGGLWDLEQGEWIVGPKTTGDTFSDRTRELVTSALQDAQSSLNPGQDGWLNPLDYRNARNEFISQVGDATQFDEAFGMMLKPADRNLLGVKPVTAQTIEDTERVTLGPQQTTKQKNLLQTGIEAFFDFMT